MTKNRRKRAREVATPGPPWRYDPSQLTDHDHALLAAFARRRARFERAIEASNIIYHKHTCPACGFPTLDQPSDYEVCTLCGWEDGVGEARPERVLPPNYTSLLAARIIVAGALAEFERTDEIEDSLDAVVRSIRRFEARCARKEAQVDRDFATHLRNILPTRPRPR